jgi:hypothetical protein
MKYIVYCTTNLINKKIYIGVHQTNDSLDFDGYIGCGVYVSQPSSYANPKTHFQYAVKKYGPKNFKRIIIKIFDNDEDAYDLEAQLVNKEYLSRKDVYNEVIGGRGGDLVLNAKPCYQYDLQGNFIKEYESQQKAAIEVGRGFTTIKRAIKEKVKSAGFFWSETKVNKLNLEDFKTENNKIPVFQYSSTGEYDCCYESVSDAARVLNNSTSNIIRGIKLGYLVNNKYFSYEFYSQFSIAKSESLRNRAVYQYSLKGEFIAEYSSQAEACRVLHKKIAINTAIKLGHTAGGFQWALEKLPSMPDISKNTSGKARKVAQYTLSGELVKIYDTVTACHKDFSGCKHVLSGKRKSSGGYTFKYLE